MQTLFERSNSLVMQLAEEVSAQHKRLCQERAEAEIQIENIELAREVHCRLVDEQAASMKKRLGEDANERINFQRHRIAQIDEQLRAYTLDQAAA